MDTPLVTRSSSGSDVPVHASGEHPFGSIDRQQLSGRRVSPLSQAWADWLSQFQWDWFVTLTFRDSKHPEAAEKLFRVWLNDLNRQLYGRNWRKRKQGVYWAKALEWQRRDVIHFHLLMSDTQDLNETLRRLTFMDKWRDLAGFSKIEKPKAQECVTRYCAKYIIKGGEIDLSPTLSSYARQL